MVGACAYRRQQTAARRATASQAWATPATTARSVHQGKQRSTAHPKSSNDSAHKSARTVIANYDVHTHATAHASDNRRTQALFAFVTPPFSVVLSSSFVRLNSDKCVPAFPPSLGVAASSSSYYLGFIARHDGPMALGLFLSLLALLACTAGVLVHRRKRLQKWLEVPPPTSVFTDPSPQFTSIFNWDWLAVCDGRGCGAVAIRR